MDGTAASTGGHLPDRLRSAGDAVGARDGQIRTGRGEESGREWFDLQLEEDELLAMAIANELGEEELDRAFGWMEEAFGSSSNEISASPVASHLRTEQRKRTPASRSAARTRWRSRRGGLDARAQRDLAARIAPRARVALLAHEEADNALTFAVRIPDRPGVPPLTDEERVRMGEEAFLGRIEIDVLHEHEGWSSFTTMAKSDLNERLEHLPEPWRKHATKRLPELRARLQTYELMRVEDSDCG